MSRQIQIKVARADGEGDFAFADGAFGLPSSFSSARRSPQKYKAAHTRAVLVLN